METTSATAGARGRAASLARVLAPLLVLSACTTGGSADLAIDRGPDAADAVAPPDTSGRSDVAVAPDTLDIAADPDALADLPQGDGGPVDEHGFRVRVPALHRIPTEGAGGQTGWTEAWDLDWMCTFRHGDTDAVFYLQDRPLKDRGFLMGGITWQTVGAFLSGNGVVRSVDAQYDTGGNHENDFVTLAFDDGVYRYYHSSFRSNWRKCQAMDCLQVLDPADGISVIEDGCTPARRLPVWCVAVAHDGTVPPLDDAFATCPDDPAY